MTEAEQKIARFFLKKQVVKDGIPSGDRSMIKGVEEQAKAIGVKPEELYTFFRKLFLEAVAEGLPENPNFGENSPP